jgi:hypothetical protein
MRRTALSAGALLLMSGHNAASAQCALPYQLTNSQLGDATKVMANFKALVRCFAPGGATNSIEYKAPGSGLGGVGPLANGQLVVGVTGAAPQATTLTAGSSVAIINGAGGITISRTGLYSQVMSATPTSALTGLTNWLNQGSAVVSDSAVGVCIDSPTGGLSVNTVGRYGAAPTPPYKITALIAATRSSTSYNGVGIGWYDGTNKLHILSYVTNNGGVPYFGVIKNNTPTSLNGNDFISAINAFSQPVWMQIADDGTNVSFGFSQDGSNFVTLFSVAKASGFLGASGYSNVIFFVDPRASRTLGTLMSWTQS